ncbi:hypothetical protein ACNRDB_08750 [Ralstonia pseudosolanacearum]|uniref:hypothetical protein n=1 Tax=Ralstonia pseudosolanacearum TaxID=1310165 RepID=UPI0018D1EF21|nr:hypothetical protein [Ralstonia pseudosolanacearum]
MPNRLALDHNTLRSLVGDIISGDQNNRRQHAKSFYRKTKQQGGILKNISITVGILFIFALSLNESAQAAQDIPSIPVYLIGLGWCSELIPSN